MYINFKMSRVQLEKWLSYCNCIIEIWCDRSRSRNVKNLGPVVLRRTRQAGPIWAVIHKRKRMTTAIKYLNSRLLLDLSLTYSILLFLLTAIGSSIPQVGTDRLLTIDHTSLPQPSQKSVSLLVPPRDFGKVASESSLPDLSNHI